MRRRRLLAWHAMSASGATTLGFSRGGLDWTVPLKDPYISLGLFVDGGYQHEQLHALVAWLEQRGASFGADKVFVEIGANIGTTCLPLAKARTCRVLAIEPLPANFALLRHNVSANGCLDRVTLVNAAIVREASVVRMATSSNIGASFIAREDNRADADITSDMDIECEGQRLDAILAAHHIRTTDVVVVWADAQGCEPDVIATGAALWASGTPLWAEFEPATLARQRGVDAFLTEAATHFDHFIDAADLLRLGTACEPRPIAHLSQLLVRDGGPLACTDVLLLPPAFRRSS